MLTQLDIKVGGGPRIRLTILKSRCLTLIVLTTLLLVCCTARAENEPPQASKNIVRKAFFFSIPASWSINKKENYARDEGYDPNHLFFIDAGAGECSWIRFNILDSVGDAKTTAKDYANRFNPIMTNIKRTEFKKWGRYDGIGITLSGKGLGHVKTTIRIFVFIQSKMTFVIVEELCEDEKAEVLPGFKMIEDTFTVTTPGV